MNSDTYEQKREKILEDYDKTQFGSVSYLPLALKMRAEAQLAIDKLVLSVIGEDEDVFNALNPELAGIDVRAEDMKRRRNQLRATQRQALQPSDRERSES